MDLAAQSPEEQELAALERRLGDIHGELAGQAEEIAACRQQGRLVVDSFLAAHERLRDSFWSLKRQCAALRERVPRRPAGVDDF